MRHTQRNTKQRAAQMRRYFLCQFCSVARRGGHILLTPHIGLVMVGGLVERRAELCRTGRLTVAPVRRMGSRRQMLGGLGSARTHSIASHDIFRIRRRTKTYYVYNALRPPVCVHAPHVVRISERRCYMYNRRWQR